MAALYQCLAIVCLCLTAAITVTGMPQEKVNTDAENGSSVLCHMSKVHDEDGNNNNNNEEENEDNEEVEEEASLDVGACSLCHCTLDYSDKAAFDAEERNEDFSESGRRGSADENENDCVEDDSSYYFRRNDPFLPPILYNPHNALLYCDSCPRMFHQHCHFVPVVTFSPSKPWNCLICKAQQNDKPSKAKRKGKMSQRMQQFPYEIMFQSPPNPKATAFEQQWEAHPHIIRLKAESLSSEMAFFRRLLHTPISAHNRARMALDTLTTTARNREHFIYGKSQEIKQCVFTLVSQQYRIRQLFEKLESVRVSPATARYEWNIVLLKWVESHSSTNADFIDRVLFPSGTLHTRRWVPLTPEYDAIQAQSQHSVNKDGIPAEVSVPATLGKTMIRDIKSHINKIPSRKASSNEEQSFSLDHLQCCVCFKGDASDDNDLILCDGQGCYRAFHAQCLHPSLIVDDNDESDWFCPLCQCMADTLLQVQAQVLEGGEWEQRRIHMNKQDEISSFRSWAAAVDVFPDAVTDIETVRLWKSGVSNAVTTRLVARLLGEDENGIDSVPENEIDDDNNIDEDSHFDLDLYQAERRRRKEQAKQEQNSRQGRGKDDCNNDHETDSASASSSQATLVEMSSVELIIEKDELAALAWDMSGNSPSSVSVNLPTHIRRLRNRAVMSEESNYAKDGRLNCNNIIFGKRKRNDVDYRKLNDALFGHVSSAKELAKLDDQEEFIAPYRQPTSQSDDVTDNESVGLELNAADIDDDFYFGKKVIQESAGSEQQEKVEFELSYSLSSTAKVQDFIKSAAPKKRKPHKNDKESIYCINGELLASANKIRTTLHSKQTSISATKPKSSAEVVAHNCKTTAGSEAPVSKRYPCRRSLRLSKEKK